MGVLAGTRVFAPCHARENRGVRKGSDRGNRDRQRGRERRGFRNSWGYGGGLNTFGAWPASEDATADQIVKRKREVERQAFRSAAIWENWSRAASRSSAISRAITSGSGRLAESSRLSSLSQKISRLALSRLISSSYSNGRKRSVALRSCRFPGL